MSITVENSGSNAVMKIAEEVPCSIFAVLDEEKKHRISSENTSFKTGDFIVLIDLFRSLWTAFKQK